MKTKIIMTIVICILNLTTFSQTNTFYISYSSTGGAVLDMKKTIDNCLILFTDKDPYNHNFVKVDTVGNIIWQTQITSPFPQNPCSIIQTTDSGYIALLNSFTGNGMITLVKLNKNGNYLWSKKFNQSSSNQGRDLCPTDNGGFAVIGGGCSGNNFVIKFDVNGTILWKNQYRDYTYTGSYGWNIIYKNNSIVIAGATGDSPYYFHLTLLSLDLSGNTRWYKVYSVPRQIIPKALINTSDEGYTITGLTNTVDTNFSRPFLLHTDSIGNLIWTKYYNHSLSAQSADLIQLDDDSYIISGSIYFTTSLNNQLLNIKTNENGNLIWGHSSGSIALSGAYSDEIRCSERINGNHFFTAGYSDKTVLLKNDSSGNGHCNLDTVNYSVTALSPTQSSPSITLLPLSFVDDTTLITSGNPGYFRNVLCSTAIGTNEIPYEVKLNIFPNPFSDLATLQTQATLEEATLLIYNSLGQKVTQINNISGQNVTLCRNNLPCGLYLIHLVEHNIIIATHKILLID